MQQLSLLPINNTGKVRALILFKTSLMKIEQLPLLDLKFGLMTHDIPYCFT